MGRRSGKDNGERRQLAGHRRRDVEVASGRLFGARRAHRSGSTCSTGVSFPAGYPVETEQERFIGGFSQGDGFPASSSLFDSCDAATDPTIDLAGEHHLAHLVPAGSWSTISPDSLVDPSTPLTPADQVRFPNGEAKSGLDTQSDPECRRDGPGMGRRMGSSASRGGRTDAQGWRGRSRCGPRQRQERSGGPSRFCMHTGQYRRVPTDHSIRYLSLSNGWFSTLARTTTTSRTRVYQT